MSRESSGEPFQAAAMPNQSGSADRACATPEQISGWQATTWARRADLDLLRLSYVCRADALLQGLPERSLVLARIHRFFDRVPPGTALDELLLSALIDRASEPAASTCASAVAGRS